MFKSPRLMFLKRRQELFEQLPAKERQGLLSSLQASFSAGFLQWYPAG